MDEIIDGVGYKFCNKGEEVKWVRAQQAAFIILIWDEIAKALEIESTPPTRLEWVDKLRGETFQLTTIEKELELDKSFVSKNSNLSRDQGVTGISMFSNDFFYVLANESDINFNELEWDNEIDELEYLLTTKTLKLLPMNILLQIWEVFLKLEMVANIKQI